MSICNNNEFCCTHGKCIPKRCRCVRDWDCQDGSDKAMKCEHYNESNNNGCLLSKCEAEIFCGALNFNLKEVWHSKQSIATIMKSR